MSAAMTPDDVRANLRLVSTETVLRKLRSGEIPGFKVGRLWRVDPDELAEWKRRRSARPADPERIEPRSPRSEAAIGKSRRT